MVAFSVYHSLLIPFLLVKIEYSIINFIDYGNTYSIHEIYHRFCKVIRITMGWTMLSELEEKC